MFMKKQLQQWFKKKTLFGLQNYFLFIFNNIFWGKYWKTFLIWFASAEINPFGLIYILWNSNVTWYLT